jgi:ribosomal protein L40E
MAIVSGKRRGVKICTKCNCENGVRAYECKECDEPFKMKKSRKRRKQIPVEDHMTLRRGDTIRVVGGSGDYYLDENKDKHYFTDRGKYTVYSVDHKGIQAYGSHGYTYIYMGKRCRSRLLNTMFKAPHKILLLPDVSSNPRLR